MYCYLLTTNGLYNPNPKPMIKVTDMYIGAINNLLDW
jgi:hypothetical protein